MYLFDFSMFSSATTKDLAHIWEDELINKNLPHNLTVEKIIDSWLVSDGVPLISVDRREEPGNQTLILAQVR